MNAANFCRDDLEPTDCRCLVGLVTRQRETSGRRAPGVLCSGVVHLDVSVEVGNELDNAGNPLAEMQQFVEHPKAVQERLGHATFKQTMDTSAPYIPGLAAAAGNRLGQGLEAPAKPRELR